MSLFCLIQDNLLITTLLQQPTTARIPLKRRLGVSTPAAQPQESAPEIETRVPVKKSRVAAVQEEDSDEESERSTPIASTSRRIRDDSTIPDIPSAQQTKRKATTVESSDEDVPVVKESIPKKKAKIDTAPPKPTSKSKVSKASPKSTAKTKVRD